MGVKRCLSWREVLKEHKTLRGIGQNSLLVDRGESGYNNRFLPGGVILYPGEGLSGHQQPVGGNRRLLVALSTQHPMQVFLREGVNCWRALGPYRVAAVDYVWEEGERRFVYWFRLEPLTGG
ncbi:MAG: hypothetical protein NZ849_07560 [Meiothermus sp.]|uniref:hypothetical protein n=1 Tax=Meiothermus sp. TaxID=1955249 RepID=UPI0025DEA87A|nr:hypothetical protein [Meiothermus sp.]MCS7057331.1 hypothetical protein [Meiothermus sp.]MCS7194750.1 hypothetical protein [Meiothermus sp.]MDW8091235.1 hypothetical protein [Meiothermus sp.]MDW8480354.1 hypothetical protein [Meiothermus sp.]